MVEGARTIVNVVRRHLDGDNDVNELISTIKRHPYMENFVEHTIDIPVVVQHIVIQKVKIVHEDDLARIMSSDITSCNRVDIVAFERVLTKYSN